MSIKQSFSKRYINIGFVNATSTQNMKNFFDFLFRQTVTPHSKFIMGLLRLLTNTQFCALDCNFSSRCIAPLPLLCCFYTTPVKSYKTPPVIKLKGFLIPPLYFLCYTSYNRSANVLTTFLL